jgi:uncharacterized protein (DUF433 family)
VGVQGHLIAENLEDLSVDEVIEQFDVTREQVEAVLEFVAESLRSEVPAAGARPDGEHQMVRHSATHR